MNDCSGVYIIFNNKNGLFYIGSTYHLRKRKNSHASFLKRGKHVNSALQKDFNIYSKDSFDYFCIEYCPEEQLVEREQYYLDKYFDSGKLYNIFKSAYAVRGEDHPMFGKKHTDASKKRIKEARSRQIIRHSEETRKKIGRPGKPANMDHIRKMVEARKDKPVWNKGLKIPNQNKIIIDSETMLKIISNYNNGMSIEKIRLAYGYEWQVVKRNLQENGIKTRNIKQQKIMYESIRGCK